MRLRLEFTTEPFDLDELPRHAEVARRVIQDAPLDAVDVGPFGNSAEGPAEEVLAAVQALLRRSFAAGATRVSLQVSGLAEDRPGPAEAAGR
ncbi:hypothetical protein [Streptomyces aidingensis]|uniref:Uncharacterized conserved protein YqgV, UPF0045/DUF77 family n=1 Tax=Streptomyces aidingensis TaxID=910347 RepID=A0A1I1ISN8_9ACTN|nr:hypothetical protein [Streptomyces aidingensis]SFC39236.1 Uncharacterized conserved protein YqgV, UPF0045/DUF77 family [Streptomyces aidingensis]